MDISSGKTARTPVLAFPGTKSCPSNSQDSLVLHHLDARCFIRSNCFGLESKIILIVTSRVVGQISLLPCLLQYKSEGQPSQCFSWHSVITQERCYLDRSFCQSLRFSPRQVSTMSNTCSVKCLHVSLSHGIETCRYCRYHVQQTDAQIPSPRITAGLNPLQHSGIYVPPKQH